MLTEARIIHGVVGVFFLITTVWLFRKKIHHDNFVLLTIAMLLGTWVPDWDLIFGIGAHRNPILHSAIPLLVISIFAIKFSVWSVIAGFSLGLASHLFWDTIYYGDVRWISGGFNDRIFLLTNMVLLILVSVYVCTTNKLIRPYSWTESIRKFFKITGRTFSNILGSANSIVNALDNVAKYAEEETAYFVETENLNRKKRYMKINNNQQEVKKDSGSSGSAT